MTITYRTPSMSCDLDAKLVHVPGADVDRPAVVAVAS
jgi:hypothetical protein